MTKHGPAPPRTHPGSAAAKTTAPALGSARGLSEMCAVTQCQLRAPRQADPTRAQDNHVTREGDTVLIADTATPTDTHTDQPGTHRDENPADMPTVPATVRYRAPRRHHSRPDDHADTTRTPAPLAFA
ncbi:hypothetical protein CLV40_13343 [Actinokineospora auranticolor]|uniref:Uncharacterized protein n=1 Tax=Actinokineospora auranticolor TaxID=155976 RepID=A0A2S6GCW5_9PSEU|nr:hypothetical protein CLV40_13343 [Actinokineospora auranticolor]